MKKRIALITAVLVLAGSLGASGGYSAANRFDGEGLQQKSNISLENIANQESLEQLENAVASLEKNDTNVSSANNAANINGTMMQYFEWDLPSDGSLWKQVEEQSDELADIGFTALWLPPAYKGGSVYDVGYGVYDLYDLGEFNQKGTVRTKYGTKDQYLAAIKAAHDNGIDIYADVVLNHKGNADGTENVTAIQKDWGNRNNSVGSYKTVKAWTVFDFPGRGNTYSSFKWDASCFDAVDYDANTNTQAIYLFEGKYWDWKVDNENANYDYLMYADVDFDSEKVVNELKSWGKWYVDMANLDGFRLDAVKHIKYPFFYDWLSYLRSTTGKELFTVGEFWSGDLGKLQEYISETKRSLSLFDVPLHNNMRAASTGNSYYDMSKILDGTLVKNDPTLAVTFIDNHDTQPGQSLDSYVLDWFKPLAYTLILTREGGYPCVFYGDYYGLEQGGKAFKYDIDKLMKARTECAYGTQHDYFDDGNIVGWTREGDSAHANSGLASIITDGDGGSKKMYVGTNHAGETWYDITGHVAEKVTIDSTGHGVFKVNGGSNSVYVSDKIAPLGTNTNGNNSVTIYYKTSWSTPYAHYCVGGGSWTTAPGVKMTKLSDGYYEITIPMGGETNVTICFNDGGNTWDNNNSRDYNFSPGKYTLNNGKITSGAPAGINDSNDSGSNSGSGNGNGSGSGTGNDSGSSTGNGSGSGSGNGSSSGSGNGSGNSNGSSNNTGSNTGTENGSGTGSNSETKDNSAVSTEDSTENVTEENTTSQDEEATSAAESNTENEDNSDGKLEAGDDAQDSEATTNNATDSGENNNGTGNGKDSSDKKDDDKNGGAWKYIIASIIVAMLGVGAYFYYQKVLTKKEENNSNS